MFVVCRLRWLFFALSISMLCSLLTFGQNDVGGEASTVRDAARRIETLGGVCKYDANGVVVEVNLAYRTDAFGRQSRNSLANDEACKFLPAFEQLERLRLSPEQVSDEGMAFIGRLKSLKELQIFDNRFAPGGRPTPVSDRGVKCLVELTSLQKLELPNALLTDESLNTIASLRQLESLRIKGNQFTDVGVARLAGLKCLKELSLGSATLTSEGIAPLTGLPLTYLDLTNANINDQVLAEIGKMTTLETLLLGRTRITDDGVKFLAGLPLVTLGLSTTRISDNSIFVLGKIESLEKLLLAGNSITGEALADLKKLVNLKELSLPVRFPEEAVAELMSELPGLRVTGSWTAQTISNLEKLGKALEEFRNEHGAYPATAPVDEFGRPLLSWRVAILPYIGEGELFAGFRFDEPWNSEHNLQFLSLMPKVMEHPKKRPSNAGYTVYQALVGEKTLLRLRGRANPPAAAPQRRPAILVETRTEKAVPWTAPQDYALDDGIPERDLFGDETVSFFYSAGGSGGVLRDSVTGVQLRSLFEVSD